MPPIRSPAPRSSKRARFAWTGSRREFPPSEQIRTTGGPPTAEELEALDAVLGEPVSLWDGGERTPLDDHVARGGREVRSQRHLLLTVLHSLQDRVGWISRGGLEYACRRLSVPPADAYGVVTFYDRFATE